MKKILEKQYQELKEKALDQFHMTGSLPVQSIAITKDLVQIQFDRARGIIPAGTLGIATKGYAMVPQAIGEGLIVAVFTSHFLTINKHELYKVQADLLYLDRKNLLWFELNSRIILIREAFYARYGKNPVRLDPIPREIFDENVESTIEQMFKLNS